MNTPADDNPLRRRPGDAPSSPLGHRMMFVVLSLLSFVAFAPTVLLPTLREYSGMLDDEVRLSQRVDDLHAELTRRELLVDAFQQDTRINELLAVLDLNYERPGEEVLPVYPDRRSLRPASGAATTVAARLTLLPDAWPAWAHRAESWVDRHGLLALYLDPSLRPILLLMSAGLIIAAFVVFAPRQRTRRGPPAAGDLVELL